MQRTMKTHARVILATTMSLAMLCGFLEPVFPDAVISFKRLHIFLFNLLSGGVLIIYFSEAKGYFSTRARLFFMIALVYALSAAFGAFWLTIPLTLPLLLILESVRIKRFSLLPVDFFRAGPVSEKLHHASALCLSIGTVIAALVMLNNQYLHWISLRKLTIDVFFLGYSFPISLITMSVMFSFMAEAGDRRFRRTCRLLQEAAFWIINLGVIIFFVFILLEMLVPEIIAASLLFVTVCLVFFLFLGTTPRLQQRTFLVSGMTFLLLTAITGIAYILRYYVAMPASYGEQLLLVHGMLSLYGWNLSGLFIIIRWNDFPIRLHSMLPISLHWLVVAVLAPFARNLPAVALVALPAYILLLFLVFLSRGARQEQ